MTAISKQTLFSTFSTQQRKKPSAYRVKLFNSLQETIIGHPLCSVKNSGLSGLAWCSVLMEYVLA